jgi:hypothetical protein
MPFRPQRLYTLSLANIPSASRWLTFPLVTPAATHVGVAKVPEPRLQQLAKLCNPTKITYATVQYVDLGGMQKERNRDALAPSFPLFRYPALR